MFLGCDLIETMKKLKLNTNKMRAEMKRDSMTYEDLEKVMHSTRQAVGYYFTNPEKLTLKTVSKIAKALNIDPKDLLI